MKIFKYKNRIEWQFSLVVVVILGIILTVLEVHYRNKELTLVLVLIIFCVAVFGVLKQYSHYNLLMEIVIKDKTIMAKRWGGVSSSVSLQFSDIQKLKKIQIDKNRKGILIEDGINSIMVGDSISDFEELMSILQKNTNLNFEV